jgi:hypothetical protein
VGCQTPSALAHAWAGAPGAHLADVLHGTVSEHWRRQGGPTPQVLICLSALAARRRCHRPSGSPRVAASSRSAATVISPSSTNFFAAHFLDHRGHRLSLRRRVSPMSPTALGSPSAPSVDIAVTRTPNELSAMAASNTSATTLRSPTSSSALSAPMRNLSSFACKQRRSAATARGSSVCPWRTPPRAARSGPGGSCGINCETVDSAGSRCSFAPGALPTSYRPSRRRGLLQAGAGSPSEIVTYASA